jgi:hypothetical protein
VAAEERRRRLPRAFLRNTRATFAEVRARRPACRHRATDLSAVTTRGERGRVMVSRGMGTGRAGASDTPSPASHIRSPAERAPHSGAAPWRRERRPVAGGAVPLPGPAHQSQKPHPAPPATHKAVRLSAPFGWFPASSGPACWAECWRQQETNRKSSALSVCCLRSVAEREGFEPSRRFPAYTLSRRAPSTTRPPLRRGEINHLADHSARPLQPGFPFRARNAVPPERLELPTH